MIGVNVAEILKELPPGVTLVGAAKTRTPAEMLEAVEAGLTILGHNYVQEAEKAFEQIGSKAKWHMIGHLQSNKAKKAVRIFDMIETVDTLKLARAIDKACANLDKTMPVLIEINSGEESQKAGVLPKDALSLIQEMAGLEHIEVQGLMTMGPFTGDPEAARPYFTTTKRLFDEVSRTGIAGVHMTYLSMGMSNSYQVAMQEGANMIRIGTRLFGERPR